MSTDNLRLFAYSLERDNFLSFQLMTVDRVRTYVGN
jgi:hypothetical protein